MSNTVTTTFAVLGALAVTRILISLAAQLFESFLRPAISLTKYGAGKGAWAVVTGASDGIGREFALQLAKKKFNIVLVARTASKLETVASEIKAKYPTSQTRISVIDFSNSLNSNDDSNGYNQLKETLDGLDVGVLVNNVGVSHDIPTPFLEESPAINETIIAVNIVAQLKVTRLVLPGMLTRKKGLILNLGSAAGVVPSGLLSVYSGSKAFLQFWSQALATEVKGKGVHVELLNTFFVTTKMSKIRRASVGTPTPKIYVAAALSRCGNKWFSTPYWAHALAHWTLENIVPKQILVGQSYKLHADIRKRALRKKEREARENKKQ